MQAAIENPKCPRVRHLAPGVRLAAMIVLLLASIAGPPSAVAASLSETVKSIKPSIVAIGTFEPTRRPPARFAGTGFAVGDGHHVVTNAHVANLRIDAPDKEHLVAFVGTGEQVSIRRVVSRHEDQDHDVAVLEIEGPPLPTLTLGDDEHVEDGQPIAFTGYPIGAVLGLFPATHRGIVSTVTPIAIPVRSQRTLDAEMIKRLRNPFRVFQLDATAYPGNSGSPLFDPGTGQVIGIVSSVFVKETKEKVLTDPSGITYAIPIRYARKLIEDLHLADAPAPREP